MISHIRNWLFLLFFIFFFSNCSKENRDWIVEVEGGDTCIAYALWGFTNIDGNSYFQDEVLVSFPFSTIFNSPENVIVSVLVVGLCANPSLDQIIEFDNSIPDEVREKAETLDYFNNSDDVVLVKIFQDGVLVYHDIADILFDFFKVF